MFPMKRAGRQIREHIYIENITAYRHLLGNNESKQEFN